MTVLMQCCPAWKAEQSSPVRIVRDKDSLEANYEGIYPCGEGAGYAGGITSAAMDGIKVAEAVSKKVQKFLGESVHLSFFMLK